MHCPSWSRSPASGILVAVFWLLRICVEVLRLKLADHNKIFVEDHLRMRNSIPHELEDGLESEAYPSVLLEEDFALVIEILTDVVLL
jgi:hypothetical protein